MKGPQTRRPETVLVFPQAFLYVLHLLEVVETLPSTSPALLLRLSAVEPLSARTSLSLLAVVLDPVFLIRIAIELLLLSPDVLGIGLDRQHHRLARLPLPAVVSGLGLDNIPASTSKMGRPARRVDQQEPRRRTRSRKASVIQIRRMNQSALRASTSVELLCTRTVMMRSLYGLSRFRGLVF